MFRSQGETVRDGDEVFDGDQVRRDNRNGSLGEWYGSWYGASSTLGCGERERERE